MPPTHANVAAAAAPESVAIAVPVEAPTRPLTAQGVPQLCRRRQAR
jgi:hypothetical protein